MENEKERLTKLIEEHGYSIIYMCYVDSKMSVDDTEKVCSEHKRRKELMEELKP